MKFNLLNKFKDDKKKIVNLKIDFEKKKKADKILSQAYIKERFGEYRRRG